MHVSYKTKVPKIFKEEKGNIISTQIGKKVIQYQPKFYTIVLPIDKILFRWLKKRLFTQWTFPNCRSKYFYRN